MSTEQNRGSIVFICDEIGCGEDFDTGYTTWDYAKDSVKQEGWYTMPDRYGGWNHYCPDCGKARYIEQKRAEEPSQKADLPWLKTKSS